VAPGHVHRAADHTSSHSAARLGLAPPEGWRVRTTAHLSLQLRDGRWVHTPANGVPFDFEWLRPDEAGLRELGQRMRQMLAAPDARRHYLLSCLLRTPELDGAVSRDELLAALDRHTEPFHNRHDIARHLARRFRDDPKLLALYRDRLTAGDAVAVDDLYYGGFWHPSLVEPLVRLYETDDNRHFGTLSLLHRHRADWIKEGQVARRLSTVVRRREPLLGKRIGDIPDQELIDWALAAAWLACTGDRAAVESLRPALDDRRLVVSPGQNAVPPLTPPARRVCDRALQAILTLLDGSPDEAYRKAQSGRPAGEDATLLHDRMIADLRRRLDNRGG
jgi:hypothetical protein